MLVRLSELLRFALKSGDIQEIPLKDEIEFIRSYLEIEQIRFQERLTVDFKIEPETLDAKIPNLILQPIIENAIRHGIAPMAKAGKVSLTSCLQNGFLELCVADNGAGISVSKTVSNGIGLKNTQERLERLYGKRHKFEIISDKSAGFSVKIVIPYHQYEQ
jgi:LytS/YehU family sensor histidine kinase